MIPVALAQCYPYEVRQRAQPYLLPHAIRWRRVDAAGVEAFVLGTQEYLVLMAVVAGEIQLGCSCPYAIDHGYCKHQWAVLSRLDQQRQLDAVLEVAGPRASVAFMSDDMEDVFLDDEEVGAEDDADDRGDGRRPLIMAPPPNAPDWKLALVETSRRQLADATLPEPGRSTSLPADRRLAYLLYLTEPPRERGLRVEIATQRRDRDGQWEEYRSAGRHGHAGERLHCPATRVRHHAARHLRYRAGPAAQPAPIARRSPAPLGRRRAVAGARAHGAHRRGLPARGRPAPRSDHAPTWRRAVGA